MSTQPVFNKQPLIDSTRAPLPLGAVVPRGWYRDQLRIQANGLTGCLEDFWQHVGQYSNWKGGSGEPTEWVPNYADGLLPLAYMLDDEKLKSRANAWMEAVLDSQTPDGNFGHFKDFRVTYYWFQLAMLKVLTQYHEVSGDERVLPFLNNYFRYLTGKLAEVPLISWSEARGGDLIYALHWLYNRTGEGWLLDVARQVYGQTLDWTGFFNELPFPSPMGYYYKWEYFIKYLNSNTLFSNEHGQFHITHGVNIAMGLKTPGLYYRQTGDRKQLEATFKGLDSLDRYHGQVNGMFTSDEHLNGTNPTQGTELCAVTEMMFSLETLLEVYPEDVTLADRLEKIAYNALPGTITDDFGAHQYDQQCNQVLVTRAKRNWYNNNDDSNLFGLEPNFVCCTANMHQGWPKLASAFFLATGDGGLAAGVYAPCEVRTTTANGAEVTITEETEYPFDETITFTVSVNEPARFPLYLRIPAWCDEAEIAVNGEGAQQAAGGKYEKIEREWRAGDVVRLRLPMKVRVSHRYNNAVSVERGPIVYALRIKEDWRKLQDNGPFGDWEVYPDSAWNYALLLDTQNVEGSFEVERRPLPVQPFANSDAPVIIRCKARRVPQWDIVDNSAGELPVSPVTSGEPDETVELIPYGAARLRVSEMPYIERSPSAAAAR